MFVVWFCFELDFGLVYVACVYCYTLAVLVVTCNSVVYDVLRLLFLYL